MVLLGSVGPDLQLLEAWLAQTIGYEVLKPEKPLRSYGSWHQLATSNSSLVQTPSKIYFSSHNS